MNNLRRAHIDRISAKLAEFQDEIEVLLDLEQEAFDNLPASIQESARGEEMESSIEQLEEAMDLFDDLISVLTEAKGEKE